MVIVEKTESPYFKGEFANERTVTEVIYITEPTEVEKEFEGEKSMKVSGTIEYEGMKKGDPNIFELNNTSKNTIIGILGPDTSKWMGVRLPIVSSIGGNKKWQILIDGARLKKSVENKDHAKKQDVIM